MEKSEVKPQAQEKRRFPRLRLTAGIPPMQKILGVTAIWPGDKKLEVVDISYKGAACALNGSDVDGHREDRVTLRIQFPESQPVKLDAEVVRHTNDIVAVNFETLGADARIAFEKFFHHKLIGHNTYKISRKFFHESSDFTHWFHGPNETNIYIWGGGGSIDKAVLEINTEILLYEGNRFFLAQGSVDMAPGESYFDFLFRDMDNHEEITNFPPIMKRSLEVLSQVPDEQKDLTQLIAVIANRS